MKTKLVLVASALMRGTSVPGGTTSTPGSESKGNPITPPDKGTDDSSAQASDGQNSATATTPGEESKGKPAIQQ
jgi:hypothetical protein